MFLVKFHSFAISFLSRSAFESYLCCADSQLSSRLYVSALWTLLREGWVEYRTLLLINFRRDVNQTLQLHFHRWIHFLLTGFDPVWPKPACTYRTSILQHAAKDRTSFVRVKPGNKVARKEISALELTTNFYSIIQNFFLPSHSVSLVKVVCHLQKV